MSTIEQEISKELDIPEVEVQVVNDSDDTILPFFKKLQDDAPDEFSESTNELNGLQDDIKKYHSGTGAESKKQEEEAVTGYGLFKAVEPPYNLEYLSKLSELNSANAAAIDAKVTNIVGLGYEWHNSFKTEEKLGDKQGNEEALTKLRKKIARAKNICTEWLESRNLEDSFTETMLKAWHDYEATGNGYIEIGRQRNGEIGYIGHVPSYTMRVRAQRDGFVQIVSNKVVFFKNYGDMRSYNPLTNDRRPNEIIHFKKYSSTNSYYGTPDILPALDAVAGNKFAELFNLDFFENKAVPRYVLIVKGGTLGKEGLKNLKSFMRGLKGHHHGTLFIPVPASSGGHDVEVEFKPIEAQIQDASFTKYYTKNRDEILMAHRTPLTKVGLAENVNLAVARDADKMFKEQVCRPVQKIIENKINKLIKEKTDILVLSFIEQTLTDEDTQSKIDERYLRMQTDTINEVRERRGYKGVPWGDVPPALNNEQRTQATGNRRRDQEREGGPDLDGEARQPKGEGSREEG